MPLLLDRFTDANGTALAAHAMDVGPGWTVGRGTWTIQGNQAEQTVGPDVDPSVAWADAGTSDATVSVLCTVHNSAFWLGPALRVQDASNLFFVLLSDGAPGSLAIYEVDGGTLIQRASAGPTISIGTQYAVTASALGQAISAAVNGGSAIGYASSSFRSQTKFGLATTGNNAGGSQFELFDDFTVTAAGSVRPACITNLRRRSKFD